ncbi:MAG: sensor histidine kinase, partial [Nannocystaceae bacterium]
IADQAKEQFLAAVSHELRTPLNSICGFAHLMLEEPEGSLTPAQREDLRLVRAGGHQLLALIDDIVDVTMVETGEFSLSLEEEDLVPRIREIVSIHRPLVHDKAIQLEFYVRGESRPILCDGRRIGQVITNLLSNAIKFTEEGSVTVSCDLESEDDFMTIEIKDTGVGISNDGLTIIFEAYKQVGEIQQRTRGTGLGLAISRAVVERHGGEIWATSSVGEGSTFFARLPRSGPPPASPEVAIREEKELDG